MPRIFGLIIAVLYATSAISAVPLESRQIGGIGCNIARLNVVTNLRQTTNAVNKLAASSDPTTADAAITAQGGLQDASDGIKTIAGALLTGQTAPAASRYQVSQGLLTAQTALNNITSTDNTVTSEVDNAMSQLEKTISAGQDVLDQCGGGGDATAVDAESNNKNVTPPDTSDTTGSEDTTSNDSSDIGTGISSANKSDTSNAAGTDAPAIDTSTADASADKSAFESPAALVKLRNSRNSRIFGKRQIGGISCNVARFQTVGRLAQASIAVNSVEGVSSGDPSAATAARQAGTALNSAKDGIAKIAVALVVGQKAPAADRDQVQKGLNDAMTALSDINTTDQTVTTAISNAQDKISSTLEAGNRVVSDC
ncbi:hypothetical protein Ac2012v2_001175 [Leucoagaricus gongylophorus]